MKKQNRFMACGLMLVTALGLVSCTSTSQMRKTKATGFLDDYSQLKEGSKGEAQMIYIKPNATWSSYDKVIIDPITAYAIPGNPLAELPKDKLNALVSYLYVAVQEQLKQDYQIVKEPGPGTLRLRLALTDADSGRPVMGVMSSIMPPAVVISMLKTAVTGSGTGTGSARVEMEILDSATGERLAAAVDAQAGNKRDFFGNFNKWDDAQDAFDGWAAKLSRRLTELRAGGK